MLQEDKKAVMGVIQECSNALTRMDAEREFIKEAIQDASERYELDKKHLRKVIQIHHKQNLQEVKYDNTEVEDLYEELYG
jgi:hypothetical protein